MKPHAAAVLAAFLFSIAGITSAAPAGEPAVVSTALADTRAAMRDLWIGHIFWVRNVVNARMTGPQEVVKAAEAQVVENARAIAGTVEPFYGKEASAQLFTLLAGHWSAISSYLDATRAARKPEQDEAYQALLANAGEIATFLSGANPHLPADALLSLLTAHGAHHVQQIQQLHARQFAEEAETWTAMKDHMYVIADALVNGIAAQFPAKFR